MAVVAGVTSGLAVARLAFVKELHDALPSAVWIGTAELSEGLYPELVHQQFAEPTIDRAMSILSEHWIYVASTRDGSMNVFRRGNRTLFLEQSNPPRLELISQNPCSALSAPFPATAPDDWLQFGTSPGSVLGALAHPLQQLLLTPCPGSGYWVRSPSNAGAIFRMYGVTSYLSITPGGASPISGESIRIAGIGLGEIEQTPVGPIVRWQHGFAYTYQTASIADAQRTACMTVWPGWICQP